ncbi:MAG: TonB-dependent receptor, partial [Melioribacteraceae bacterium]|nr:TonB-dependent receptor [Melioribacteraceae bacterium]
NRNYVSYDQFQNDTLLNPVFLNNSKEAENEIKADLIYKIAAASEVNFGASLKYINFDSEILFPEEFVTTFGETLPINSVNVTENFIKSSLYGLYSAFYFNRLRLNLGIRADYFDAIENKLTVSPRLSLSYFLTERTNLNFSTGIFRQTPSYIWLTLPENRKLESIQVNQFILGISHELREDTRLKVEGFYKDYSKYPASQLRPYLVLANTGVGFGGAEENYSSFGLEPLTSDGSGYSRGVELSVQKKSSRIKHYGLASITYSESNFTALDGIERTGQYDQRWIINVSAGYIFNRNWEASLKFRYATGSPYTTFNNDGTQNVSNYLTRTLGDIHSLDLRVDRRWDFEGWALITYLDVQNVYNNKNITQVRWDIKEQKVEENEEIGILPSIGISLEF